MDQNCKFPLFVLTGGTAAYVTVNMPVVARSVNTDTDRWRNHSLNGVVGATEKGLSSF